MSRQSLPKSVGELNLTNFECLQTNLAKKPAFVLQVPSCTKRARHCADEDKHSRRLVEFGHSRDSRTHAGQKKVDVGSKNGCNDPSGVTCEISQAARIVVQSAYVGIE
jgi:hypothetical protein